jgi:UDP-N-acetylglucosamine 4-epimerase
VHREIRRGDLRFSLADTSKARHLLGYRPTHRVTQGLERAINWYLSNLLPVEVERKVVNA